MQEERQVRLAADAALHRRIRSNESVEEREERLALDQQRRRETRAEESVAERERRHAADSQGQLQRRARESQERRRHRQYVNAEQMQNRRATETEEERELRRRANSERQRRRRLNSNERNAENERNAQRQRSTRERETSSERQVRRTAARNAATQRDNVSRRRNAGIGRLHGERPPLHYLGRLEVECESCGAKHFAQERPAPRTCNFNSCCNFGRIRLQMFVNFPREIRDLFEGFDERAKHFRVMIRNYNNALAMASMTATLDTPLGGGPYCFRVHGQVYHSTGPLRSLDGQPPVFAQIYIFDTETATNELAGRIVNQDCRRDVFTLLLNTLQRDNVFVHSYRMMDEVAREEEERSWRENRPQLPVRMVFETRASDDRRRYNVATSNEIAAVYKGDDEHIEGERRLVIMERSGRLSFIKDYDPICDPLTYPLLFPRGETGWDPRMRKEHVEGRKRSNLTQREYNAYIL